jgi:hypothetical protein
MEITMTKLFSKYKIEKADGSPVDPNAMYFVLRIDTDVHARIALRAYARSIRANDPEFANELDNWIESRPANALVDYKQEVVCEWKQEEYEDCWESSCGETWIIDEGTPVENGMNYCAFCGHPLKQQLRKQIDLSEE